MAKKTKAARKRAAGKQNQGKMVVTRVNERTLDKAALDYAHLLSDPCNARICPPIFPGADAGFLFRAESFGVVGTGTGQTAGFVHFVPGYVNGSLTHLLTGGNVLSSTNMTAAAAGIQSPGYTFVTNNSRAARCVAACLKISFSGAESARSGRLHFGNTPAGLIDVGQLISADAIAQALTNYTRTPADTIEIIWKPSIADTEFNDPSEVASATIRDRKAAITVAFAGLPPEVGITWHATAVYEWQPVTALGVGGNPTGKADSRNSLDDVVDFLTRNGERFVRSVGANLMGGAMNQAVNVMSSVFGTMPARSYQRQLAFR